MRNRRHLGWLVCIIITMSLAAGSASGAAISINSLGDWQRGVESMMIVPVDYRDLRQFVGRPDGSIPDAAPEWSEPIMLKATDPSGQALPPVEFVYADALLFTPTLTPEMHEAGGPVPPGPLQQRTEPSLTMRWGDPGPNNETGEGIPQPGQRVAAAWDLVLGGPNDPGQDFETGDGILEFSIHGPAECMIVSVNMIDGNGNYREWWWHIVDPNHPEYEEEIRPCEWTDVWVNPITGAASHNPVMYFTHGPGVFDLSNITSIRFDENGIWSPDFIDPATGLVWNAWDHVQTVPEPATMLAVFAGACGLAGYLRRRRRA